VPTLDDCYPWQPDGCEWTIRYLWRWMSSFGRLDIIVLALMLVYLFAVVIHVRYRYYLARRLRRIDSAGSKKLAAALNIKVSSLKSIALTAPCLGLAGTCVGILSALGGVGMEKHTALAMIATRIALALIPTALGIPVAVLATCFYNYFCTRMDLLEGEVFEEGQERGRHFRRARRFPPTERFAELPAFGLLGALPAFGLLAALGLTVLVKMFMPLSSSHPPTGFYVELPAHVFRDDCGDFDVTILEMSKEKMLTINSKPVPRETLATRLSDIYRLRAERLLLVKADPNLSFQDVASIIDVANGSVENLYVTLVTPGAEKEPCLVILRPRKRAEPLETH
jgi:biopolymer transport protein ExbD